MKTACLLIVLLGLGVIAAQAADPQTLRQGSWVCQTPEGYDQAVDEEHQEKDLPALKQRLLDQKLCMYIDNKYLEDMMAPFVQVIDRQGEKVKVSFTVEFYKRIATLHRRITRVTYTGWTDAGNLRIYEP
jgi:hypothetical protein